MELQIIRHKDTSDYFRDFFPPDTAAAYSYQLQRMFESGAAKEGDYFLVKDEGKSYLQAEIYRNNTRRIWEKTPIIDPKDAPDEKKNYEAIKLIFDFLKSDEYYFSPSDRLEIIVKENTDFSEIMKSLSDEFGYKKIEEYQEYRIKLTGNINPEVPEPVSIVPFKDLEPEERFRIVSENSAITKYLEHADPALQYQDFLDDGYFSEQLWELIYVNNGLSGFVMPSFTSGLKNRIKLLNYSIINNVYIKEISKAIVGRVVRISADQNVSDLEFIVKGVDNFIYEEIISLGGIKTGTFIRYIQN
jgi:hypothetical protein